MKKVLAACLMVVMLFCMSVSAFAVPTGFVMSPSQTPAPEIVTFQPKDEDCTARLIITPYSERNNLSDNILNIFEKAYKEITESKDLTNLNTELAKAAFNKNIKGENLAVSDLFDIHYSDCDFHDGHVGFDITLDADILSHFVGLLHMKKNGEWELIKNAKVVNNGTHLNFSVDSLSPFAIIVDTTDAGNESPKTGDSSMLYVYAVIIAALSLSVIAITAKTKKQRV